MDNKVCLITGASGQLGNQFCKTFSDNGSSVCVSDLNLDSCQNVLKNLVNPSKHLALEIDVSNEDSVKNGLKKIKKKYGKLDFLINNAGIAVFSSFKERKFSEFMNVMKVNVGGTFLCIKESIDLLKLSEYPSIINIGSIYGIGSGDPRLYTDCDRNTSECYGASKAGVLQMTKYFSVHLAESNIRVNSISPGGIFNNQGEDFIRNYSFRTPLKRMANVDEISGAAIFLCSSESSYITGQNIIIDGGWTSW